MPTTTVRPATPQDAAIIRGFILELAIYEKEPDAVKVTVEELAEQLASDRPPFEALIAELDGIPVGFALFFQSYSTWEGKAGLYLEDLYVSPEHRGNKIGTALFRQLSQIALDRGYARIDWQVLDWNEPALRFYEKNEAIIEKEWWNGKLFIE